jgi:hypothetical protein
LAYAALVRSNMPRSHFLKRDSAPFLPISRKIADYNVAEDV